MFIISIIIIIAKIWGSSPQPEGLFFPGQMGSGRESVRDKQYPAKSSRSSKVQ